MTDDDVVVIDVQTPLGFRAVCTLKRWMEIATIKHPAMRDRLHDVIQTLSDPDMIRRSAKDSNVLLFYRHAQPRFVCVVLREKAGYVITAYPADRVKQGNLVWIK